jgi:mannitol-1-/sugar-/sorbitol-6-/2-deoxyglucose-6-phosphatase
MIQAVIFDMDGLLIDSEPLWTQAEIEVFATVGIALNQERCAETVGMGLEEVVAFRFAEQPWKNRSPEEVADAIHHRVTELVRKRGEPMPSAIQAVNSVKERGWKVGLATASDPVLIAAALGRLGLTEAFEDIQSASGLMLGKPHPEVYLRAAEHLGIPPAACVGIEDSIPGLIAVKAAKMMAVAVPEPRLKDDPRFQIADVVIGSLEELNDDVWKKLEG